MGRRYYRKTNRRQRRRPVWSPRPQERRTIVWPVPPTGDVTGTFLLPGELSLIAPGRHGVAIVVTAGGFVQIARRSREHVIRLAAEFFATVARDRMPFAVAAVIGDYDRGAVRDGAGNRSAQLLDGRGRCDDRR
jgi:hypothetical protein